ncbi:MAG: ornithine carbamoyltransferase [Candidatus Omnitrophica bacterium]|nr:ornithine carbamoyltransferase [Candidatus Omnitrophota bacterium]MDE2009389.1 ornithine carbamoyltransferase [Candidatus Omnitrophota bacterium]MDE2214173.1 ornithine carbamoyltransferase [Candidatus Omnitrophota bacterium]MDE2231210.1 ornithine carbamoyltransferase [Candidatus Omnitrophota bacterium]
MKRDFIKLSDYSGVEILGLVGCADRLKRQKGKLRADLKGKSVALVFQKPSNRTRVSFEVGVYELGGHCLYLGPEEINLGKRESTPDVAKTLSRYVHCIVARVYDNKDIVELARYADVPVINALCDLYHPCQALADIQTIRERFGKFKGLTLAYVGDGNNVFHSLMVACALVGINVRFAGPKGYDPDPEIVRHAAGLARRNKCTIELGRRPQEAVKAADVIYSDVWVSMGQEKETARRVREFRGYQINAGLLQAAHKDYIFMHCLPAHRGLEVTADIIDGKHSVIFDQAENRLHAQKAVLLKLLERSL